MSISLSFAVCCH